MSSSSSRASSNQRASSRSGSSSSSSSSTSSSSSNSSSSGRDALQQQRPPKAAAAAATEVWVMDDSAIQRHGKWTQEEEDYSNRLMHEFKDGVLPLEEDLTLRSFLARWLHCDPMRISKKYSGSSSLGKQVYKRRSSEELARLPPNYIAQVRHELSVLESRFLDSVSRSNKGYRSAPARSRSGGRGVSSRLGGGGNEGGGYAAFEEDDSDSQRVASAPKDRVSSRRRSEKAGYITSTSTSASASAGRKTSRNTNSITNTESSYLAETSETADTTMRRLHRVTTLDRLASIPIIAGRRDGMAGSDYQVGMGHLIDGSSASMGSLAEWPSMNNLAAAAALRNSGSGVLGLDDDEDNNGDNDDDDDDDDDDNCRGDGGGNGDSEGCGDTDDEDVGSFKAGGGRSSGQASSQSGGSKESLAGSAQSSSSSNSNSNSSSINAGGAVSDLTGNGYGKRSRRTAMPQSASVDNFWMLVNSGDLPKPDTNVLSESLKETTGTVGDQRGGKGRQGGSLQQRKAAPDPGSVPNPASLASDLHSRHQYDSSTQLSSSSLRATAAASLSYFPLSSEALARSLPSPRASFSHLAEYGEVAKRGVKRKAT